MRWGTLSFKVALTSGRNVYFVSWILEWLALPNAALSQKRRFYSPYCSNYVPNSVAACLHCTAQTELCTVYVTRLHVHLLLHNDIYSCSAYPVRLNPRCFPWKHFLDNKLCYFLFTYWQLRRNTKVHFQHTNPKIRGVGRVVRNIVCSLLGQPQFQYR